MGNKSISRSFFWKLLEKISVQGINLLVQIVLARILLPSDFGNLAIIVAIINYISIFVQSGISTVIIQRQDITDTDISTLFISGLSIAMVLYFALFFSAPFISNIYETTELIWPLRALASVLFLNSINAIQIGIYSKRMEFKKIFLRSIIAVPIAGAIGIMMAYNGYGLWALVVHNIVNMGLTVLIMLFDRSTWFKFNFSFQRLKILYSFAGKIILTSVITGGGDLIRTLIIGKRYSVDDLAYYDKAYTYSNYTSQIIGQSVTSVMLPSFSKIQDDKKALKDLSRQSIRVSAYIMFPVLLGFAVVAEPFVKIVLTDKWLSCVPYLMIFCVLRMPSFISSIDKQVYYALGRSGINLIYETLFLVLNISTILISIQFGIIWIAICITALEWLGCFCLFFVSKKVYNYTILERLSDLWRPLLNSTIMFLCCFLIGKIIDSYIIKLLVQIISGILIYVLMCFITRDDNYKVILNILRRKKTND